MDFVRAWTRHALILAFLVICSASAAKQGPATVTFDIPSGLAVDTLREAARQGDIDIMFAAHIAAGVVTEPLHGNYTPEKGLKQMLSGTALDIVLDPKTGAFAVVRKHARKATKLEGSSEYESDPTMTDKTYINSNHKKLFKGFIAVLLGTASSEITAQQVNNASDEEPIFELSPFEVNASDDIGYVATNTLAGSRLNTALVDTPASISVMTQEFLSDIGANDVNDAIRYSLSAGNDIGGGSANVGASTGNGIVGNEFNFQIRGFRNAVATRDYFPTLLASDMFNTERIEVARGPNSLVFGVGGPGGIVNTAVKQANANEDFNEIGLQIGSYSEQRATVDLNRALIDGKLGVRFNGMYQESDGWKDFATNDQERGALAFVYRPLENTQIRLNTEFGSLLQNRVRPWAAVDQSYSWEGQGQYFIPFGTSEAPWLASDSNYSQTRQSNNNSAAGPSNGLTPNVPAGETFERRTAHLGNPYIMLMDGPLAGKMVHVGERTQGARYYRTSFGNNIAGYNTPVFFDDESLYPRTANVAGPGAKHFTDYYTYNASINQRFGQNFNVNLTLAKTEIDREDRNVMGFADIAYKIDVTTTLPTFNTDGSYNATIGGPDTDQGVGTLNFNQVVNNPYVGSMIASSSPSYSLTDQSQDDIRLSASYHLDLDSIGDHMILGFAQSSKTGSERESFAETNVSPNRQVTTSWFGSSNYPGRDAHIDVFSSDLAKRGFPDPWENPLPSGIYYGIDPSLGYEFEAGWVRNNWNASETTIDSYALALQSRFFSDSLVTTLGYRHDEVEIVNTSRIVDSLGEATGLGEPGAPQTEKGDTYSIGAVYHIPSIDWLSVFANKSTNFQPQSGAQFAEDEVLRPQLEIGALEGTGYDYGVKLNLLDNKAFATFTMFKVEQENAVTGFNGNVRSYIDAIWTTILNGGPVTEMTDAQDPNGHRFGGSDTRDQSAEGWELELTANPTPNWRLSFNFSKSDNAVSSLGNAFSAYLEKHRAEWQAASALSYDTGRDPGFLGNNTVGDLLNGLDQLLALVRADEGVAETNVRPYNGNVFTAYSFSEGALKGLTIGGGVNYYGDQILGIKSATLDNPVATIFKGRSYYMTNAMIGYSFPLNEKVQVRLQLNIDNLLDNDDKQVLASQYNDTIGDLDYYEYYLEPRSYSFRANFLF